MKQSLFVGIAILMLCLSGCRNPAPEGDLPLNQTVTEEGVVRVPTVTITVSPTPEPTETLTATSTPFIPVGEGEDYFVYSTIKNPPKLEYYLFIPEMDQKFEIFANRNVYSFSLNANNQLAFVSDYEDGHAIYIDNFPFIGNDLQKIAGDTNTYYDLFSWSEDGQYLALIQLQDQFYQIMIWDGESLIPVYSFQNQVNDVIWSKDNRLAFVEHRFDCDNCDHGEVYVWDGDRTLNVSQNSESEDRFPAWSNDGQLAYQSESENEYSIFIWDGKSLINDLPNRYKIETGDSIHLWYTSIPSWTDKNQLLFESTSHGNQDSDHLMVNLFMWEMGTAKQITYCTNYHCGGMLQSEVGYWSYITFLSYPSLIFVMDENDQQVTALDAEYMPAWSSSDNLLYCNKDNSGWVLNLWNIDSLIEIDIGYEIIGQWNNGNKVYCTSG